MSPLGIVWSFIIITVSLFLLSWLAFDLWVVLWERKTYPYFPTITGAIQRSSKQYPAIPFVAGFVIGALAGHFYGEF